MIRSRATASAAASPRLVTAYYVEHPDVSRPEERLYLSWHEAGDDGEQRVRSFFVSDVCDLFGPDLQTGRRTRSLGGDSVEVDFRVEK